MFNEDLRFLNLEPHIWLISSEVGNNSMQLFEICNIFLTGYDKENNNNTEGAYIWNAFKQETCCTCVFITDRFRVLIKTGFVCF